MTSQLPNAGPYADHQLKERGRWARIGMGLVVALGLGSGLLWAGAIIWGEATDPKPVNWKTDRRFFEAAEPICKRYVDEVATFPKAHEAADTTERSETILATSALLTDMVEELRTKVPADSEDAKWINMWLDDYDVHIADRVDFAERIVQPGGEKEEFFETPKADKQISRSLDEFAKQNEIYSCETTDDV